MKQKPYTKSMLMATLTSIWLNRKRETAEFQAL